MKKSAETTRKARLRKQKSRSMRRSLYSDPAVTNDVDAFAVTPNSLALPDSPAALAPLAASNSGSPNTPMIDKMAPFDFTRSEDRNCLELGKRQSSNLSRQDRGVGFEDFSDFAVPLASPVATINQREVVSEPERCNVTDSGDLKSLRNIQKRSSATFKHMPDDPVLRAGAAIHHIGRVCSSPSTKELVPKLVAAYPQLAKKVDLKQEKSQEKDRNVLKHARRLAVYSHSKNEDGKKKTALLLQQQGTSLRALARTAGMHVSQVHQMIKGRKSRVVKGKKVSLELRNQIILFFMRDTVSQQIPIMRFSKLFFLRQTEDETYQMFVQHQNEIKGRIIAQQTLFKYKPKWCRIMGDTPNQECLCNSCLNFRLLADALIAAGVGTISHSVTENCMLLLCKPEIQKEMRTKEKLVPEENTRRRGLVVKTTIGEKKRYNEGGVRNATQKDYLKMTDFAIDCVFKKCLRCGSGEELLKKIDTESPGLNYRKIVVWRQWQDKFKEMPDGTLKKVDYTRQEVFGSISQLIAAFLTKLKYMAIHIYHFRRQAAQYELVKKQLKAGEVLMVMDFAMNMTHQPYKEPQNGMWNRKQSTLHPVVCFYLCLTCRKKKHLVKHEVICISEDLKHDSSAVKAYEDVALEVLRESRIDVRRVIQFTDNAGAQYKCCAAFSILSKRNIPFERHYFGQQHGKGAADAAIGRFKHEIDKRIRSGKAHSIHRGSQLFDYVKESMQKKYDLFKCDHSKRSFRFVHDIDRSVKVQVKTIPGTLKFHCVKSTGIDDVVVVREVSCFCSKCHEYKTDECEDDKANFAKDEAYNMQLGSAGKAQQVPKPGGRPRRCVFSTLVTQNYHVFFCTGLYSLLHLIFVSEEMLTHNFPCFFVPLCNVTFSFCFRRTADDKKADDGKGGKKGGKKASNLPKPKLPAAKPEAKKPEAPTR